MNASLSDETSSVGDRFAGPQKVSDRVGAIGMAHRDRSVERYGLPKLDAQPVEETATP
jgi:hypothetical protein